MAVAIIILHIVKLIATNTILTHMHVIVHERLIISTPYSNIVITTLYSV